jgi:hypothetical protein
MSRGCRIHADCPANRERECYKRWCQEIGMRPNIRQDGKQETATRKSSRSNGKDQHRRRNVRPRFALRGHQPEDRHHRLFRDSHNAETDRTLRFKRTVERRDTSVSRETASEGPSPAQLTELRLLYTMTRSRGFPRRRPGSRNRRVRAVSAFRGPPEGGHYARRAVTPHCDGRRAHAREIRRAARCLPRRPAADQGPARRDSCRAAWSRPARGGAPPRLCRPGFAAP